MRPEALNPASQLKRGQSRRRASRSRPSLFRPHGKENASMSIALDEVSEGKGGPCRDGTAKPCRSRS